MLLIYLHMHFIQLPQELLNLFLSSFQGFCHLDDDS
jgi:hypothetical protein